MTAIWLGQTAIPLQKWKCFWLNIILEPKCLHKLQICHNFGMIVRTEL